MIKFSKFLPIITLVGLTSILACSNNDDISGSGDLTTEIRQVPSFNAIENEGAMDIYVVVGEEQSVEVIGDDNILRYLETEVEDNELSIELEDGRNYNNIDIEVFITVPSLRSIENEGSGQVEIENINSTTTFQVDNEGSGNIQLSGLASRLELENEGSGDIMAFDLNTQISKISLEGSGNVEISCSDLLEVEIEGSGNVYYLGSPEINSEIQGSGAVIDAN